MALEKIQDYSADNADKLRKGQIAILTAKGEGTDDIYMIEVDPVTGEIPVSATLVLSNDTDYGTVGANTLRTAAQIGNATGAAAFGAGTSSAQTLRVVIASDQLPLSSGSYVTSTRTDHTITPVTTGAWVQLVASLSAAVNNLTIFSSSGQELELGIGAAAAETRVLYLPPGGFDSTTPLHLPSGSRISVRAISGTASTGILGINYLG